MIALNYNEPYKADTKLKGNCSFIHLKITALVRERGMLWMFFSARCMHSSCRRSPISLLSKKTPGLSKVRSTGNKFGWKNNPAPA